MPIRLKGLHMSSRLALRLASQSFGGLVPTPRTKRASPATQSAPRTIRLDGGRISCCGMKCLTSGSG